jgi:pimeloyl-ACP methyl ester carboxylesterase
MPKRCEQEIFAPMELGKTGLNLHARAVGRPDRLVILIHGLGGSAYKTWGNLPRYLFENAQVPMDVAVYGYTSGHKRLVHPFAGSLDGRVDQLHAELLELESDYDAIHVVGHSLGGVLAGLLAMEYFHRRPANMRSGIAQLASVVALASPRLGTAWSSVPLRWLNQDLRALRFGSRHTSNAQDFFLGGAVNTSASRYSSDDEFLIPTFACVATDDAFVKKFSATFGVPMGQRKYLNVSHTNIAKPDGPTDDQVSWLLKTVRRIEASRQDNRQIAHTARHASGPRRTDPSIVTELWTSPGPSSWTQAFDEAVQNTSTADIQVYDRRDANRRSDLIVSVSSAEAVLARSSLEQQKVIEVLAAQSQVPETTVGFSPVGAQHEPAVAELGAWIADSWKQTIWLEGSEDATAFGDTVSKWLQLLISRRRYELRVRFGSAWTSDGGLDVKEIVE